MKSDKQTRIENDDRAVAIYHVVYAHEGFNQSAQSLFKIVRMAEQQQPGKKRILCLDIEGHRDPDGSFDADMYELQDRFLLGFLGQYLSEIYAPLIKIKNQHPQMNDIPPELIIQPKLVAVK